MEGQKRCLCHSALGEIRAKPSVTRWHPSRGRAIVMAAGQNTHAALMKGGREGGRGGRYTQERGRGNSVTL